MAEWQTVRLGEIVKTNQSTYSPKENWQFVNYLDTGNITMNKIDEIQYINTAKDKLPSRARRKVKTNSIIYSTVRPNQLHYGVIKEQPDNFLVSTGFTVIDVNYDKAVPDFIYYALTKQEVTEQLQAIAEQSVSAYPSLKPSDIENLEFMLPDKKTQERIVAILRSIDEKIKENNAINNNLLEQALAIYKDWFCDYALSDGVLPENWKITTIDAISSLVTRGIAPKYDDSSDQIVLNQKCIRDHTIDISLSRRHLPKKINEKWISKGDLLINSTGTGTLGRVAQVWFEANNMTVDSHVTIVRPKDPILQSYIGFWGLSHESEIEAQHTGSTGQTELPRDRVKAMELPLPDEDTLSKFNELVIPMTSTVISNQEENDRLSQLRDALLPKLMSGELDVSDIDL